VEFQLKESALFKEIYDNSVMPFDGSYPYFTQTSTHGYTLSNDRVKFPLKRFDPANAELIGALAKGTRIVIILEQYINGSARFCVFGLSGGLRLSEETALDMSGDDKTIEVDLVDVNTNYPNLFLWAGSEAATLLLLESMTGVRVQSIDSPIFELGVTWGLSSYDWGSTIVFTPSNATDKRLIFESSDPTVAEVDQDGVIDAVSDVGEDDFRFCTVTATSVDGGKVAETLVLNDQNFGIFKFNFGGGNFTALFDESCYLVKPNGDIVALTMNVAEACPAGVCHLIYEKTNTIIDISTQNINGEIKSLLSFEINLSSNDITFIKLPNTGAIGAVECLLLSDAIASILADAVLLPDLSAIYIDISGGTNAAIGTWSAQAIADKDTIVSGGGTVTFNS
jgi:hypothetical protein